MLPAKKRNGVTPAASTGTDRGSLLQQLRKSRRREEVETLVGRLGELTSVKEASMAISAWGRVRDWKRALELLSEMRERGLEPNVITYNAAISACEKGSQWERALELLSEMRERGLAPNVISYSAAISACEKGSQWERALELLSEMRERGLAPNVITYSAVVEACCRNAGAETEARRVYRDSLESGARSHWKGPNVDLHDLSVAIAKTAIAVVLEDIRSGQCTRLSAGSDLVIITGRGKHSEDGAALLRPAVLEMLAQPEYAVLDAAIDPSNEGCVRVPAARLVCWSLDERTENPAEAGGDE